MIFYMGSILTKCINNFECESNCTINHELDEKITTKSFCFNSIELSQKDIKNLNLIVKKYSKNN